jgi:NAD(P)-dependent dehydrogenase (short-subunit alcohol dehydrogenase family)
MDFVAMWKAKRNPPSDPTDDFTGKTVIITGANTGLGYEAALKFVSLHAQKVILAVRSIEKGETAKAQIMSALNGKPAADVIEVWALDMSSYPSIEAFASRASSELEKIEIVILNAGIMNLTHEVSQYGWESTIQINAISTTLLALLLLPKIRASKSITSSTPILEFVSSSMYKTSTIPPAFQSTPLASYSKLENFAGQDQYAISKFLLQCSIKSISQLVSPEEVIVTSVCPGACKSDLARSFTNPILRIALRIMHALFFRTTEEGARTLVSGITQGEKSHGIFWTNDKLEQ